MKHQELVYGFFIGTLDAIANVARKAEVKSTFLVCDSRMCNQIGNLLRTFTVNGGGIDNNAPDAPAFAERGLHWGGSFTYQDVCFTILESIEPMNGTLILFPDHEPAMAYVKAGGKYEDLAFLTVSPVC